MAAGVLADVVLHPGTLTGTIGFTGWTPTSTTVAIANGAFTGQTSADADGNFTLTVEGDQSYTAEYVTLFWGTRAYSSFTPTQSVFVPVGGTVRLNLRQPGATLAGGFPVTGGTLAGWALSVTGDGSPFTTSDSNDVSTFSVPIVAGTPYRVEATVQVNVADEFGGVLCSVPILFGPISQPAVSEGATNTLTLGLEVPA